MIVPSNQTDKTGASNPEQSGDGAPVRRRRDFGTRKWTSAEDAPLDESRAPCQCVVVGCERKPKSVKMCQMHYMRIRVHGSHGPVESKVQWGRTGPYFKEDYMFWHVKDENGNRRTLYEHQRVMEEHLGRRLMPDESVHHKNGIRSDNRIENLELWRQYQPAGQRVEDLVAYAIELLRQYAPDMLKE